MHLGVSSIERQDRVAQLRNAYYSPTCWDDQFVTCGRNRTAVCLSDNVEIGTVPRHASRGNCSVANICPIHHFFGHSDQICRGDLEKIGLKFDFAILFPCQSPIFSNDSPEIVAGVTSRMTEIPPVCPVVRLVFMLSGLLLNIPAVSLKQSAMSRNWIRNFVPYIY